MRSNYLGFFQNSLNSHWFWNFLYSIFADRNKFLMDDSIKILQVSQNDGVTEEAGNSFSVEQRKRHMQNVLLAKMRKRKMIGNSGTKADEKMKTQVLFSIYNVNQKSRRKLKQARALQDRSACQNQMKKLK